MKTNTIQNIETFKISSLIPLLSPVVILLLFYSLRWSAVSGAFLFTAMVCSSPAIFRTRGGSLIPAICLAVFVWLSATVVFILGAH
jgi:hypothetical protein